MPEHDNEAAQSATEIEYRHVQATNKPILAFLLDPENPWPPNSMDSASADGTAAAKMSALRSEVGGAYLAGIFTSPEDLASQVAAAVASLGMTAQVSQLVLNRTAVSADSMGALVPATPCMTRR